MNIPCKSLKRILNRVIFGYNLEIGENTAITLMRREILPNARKYQRVACLPFEMNQ